MKNRYSVLEQIDFSQFKVDIKNKTIDAMPTIDLNLICESELKDHYRIIVYKSYKIDVFYGNSRSLKYAFDFLSKQSKSIETGIYEDGPDFEMRGIIEGFYGTPWSHSDRLDVIHFINQNRMNTYFYAPKDDQYHRQLWRDLYPLKELNQLLELINYAKDVDVDFYFCISPGNDFDYSKKDEFDILFAKINQLLTHGVTHFALLMDDINYQLNETNQALFKTPGRAHAHITNLLNSYLKSQSDHTTLVMCPTEYWQNWDTEYRSDLKTQMDDDVLVFWTGYNTIAEYIPNVDGINVKKHFGHPLVLWDNYPVNDMTTDRIFLGPLANRGKALSQTHVGMVANPMIEWHLSKVSLLTMADYMWDSYGYDPEVSYEKAIIEMTKDQPEIRDAFKVFCENNRHSLIQYYHLKDIEKAIETLNYDDLDHYFMKTQKAFNQLLNGYANTAFVNQAKPWINRFDQDVLLWEKIKKGSATVLDTAYFVESKHTIGSHVIVKLAKKLNLFQGDIYKKNRINYWDQK